MWFISLPAEEEDGNHCQPPIWNFQGVNTLSRPAAFDVDKILKLPPPDEVFARPRVKPGRGKVTMLTPFDENGAQFVPPTLSLEDTVHNLSTKRHRLSQGQRG